MGKNPDIVDALSGLAREVPSDVPRPHAPHRRRKILRVRVPGEKAVYTDGYVTPSKREATLVQWIGSYKAVVKRKPGELARPMQKERKTPDFSVPSDMRVRFTEAMARADDPPILKQDYVRLMADFLTAPKQGFDAWYLEKAKEPTFTAEERKGFLQELLRTYLHRIMHTKPSGLPVVERGRIQSLVRYWEHIGYTNAHYLGVTFPEKKSSG
jgi:hypothetical protein